MSDFNNQKNNIIESENKQAFMQSQIVQNKSIKYIIEDKQKNQKSFFDNKSVWNRYLEQNQFTEIKKIQFIEDQSKLIKTKVESTYLMSDIQNYIQPQLNNKYEFYSKKQQIESQQIYINTRMEIQKCEQQIENIIKQQLSFDQIKIIGKKQKLSNKEYEVQNIQINKNTQNLIQKQCSSNNLRNKQILNKTSKLIGTKLWNGYEQMRYGFCIQNCRQVDKNGKQRLKPHSIEFISKYVSLNQTDCYRCVGAISSFHKRKTKGRSFNQVIETIKQKYYIDSNQFQKGKKQAEQKFQQFLNKKASKNTDLIQDKIDVQLTQQLMEQSIKRQLLQAQKYQKQKQYFRFNLIQQQKIQIPSIEINISIHQLLDVSCFDQFNPAFKPYEPKFNQLHNQMYSFNKIIAIEQQKQDYIQKGQLEKSVYIKRQMDLLMFFNKINLMKNKLRILEAIKVENIQKFEINNLLIKNSQLIKESQMDKSMQQYSNDINQLIKGLIDKRKSINRQKFDYNQKLIVTVYLILHQDKFQAQQKQSNNNLSKSKQKQPNKQSKYKNLFDNLQKLMPLRTNTIFFNDYEKLLALYQNTVKGVINGLINDYKFTSQQIQQIKVIMIQKLNQIQIMNNKNLLIKNKQKNKNTHKVIQKQVYLKELKQMKHIIIENKFQFKLP